MKVKSFGFCVVDIIINDMKYKVTRLNVLDNLCSDIILGLDFQSQYAKIFQIFKFNTNLPKLVVSRAGEPKPEPERGAMEPANFGGTGAGATKILLAPAPVMVHRINFIE